MTLLPQPSVTLGLMFGNPLGSFCQGTTECTCSCHVPLEQTPGTPGSVFLQLLALTCGNLWVIPRLDGVHTRRGIVPGIGAASAQHTERGLVPSPLVGVGPASSQTQLEAEGRW